jgi:DNA-binding MarR family transcriptional regulator
VRAVVNPSKMPCMPKPELENVDALTARAFHALGRMMHLNRLVMMKIIAQRGVQPPEAFALSLLSEHDGIGQRELAEILHLSPPRVSVILRALEENGAVLRQPDEADRRLARVFITAEGRHRENEQRAVLGDYVGRTIGALPEADRLELERVLNKLADRVTAVLQEEHEAKTQGEDMSAR